MSKETLIELEATYKELGEKIEKITIERCADESRKYGVTAGCIIANGLIRYLPTGQIKLEELL